MNLSLKVLSRINCFGLMRSSRIVLFSAYGIEVVEVLSWRFSVITILFIDISSFFVVVLIIRRLV